jgi:hypothetical protein
MSALMEMVWNNYCAGQYHRHNDRDSDWGILDVRFHGTANFYISRRDAPARREWVASQAARPEKSDVAGPRFNKKLFVIVLCVIALLILFGILLPQRS